MNNIHHINETLRKYFIITILKMISYVISSINYDFKIL